MDKRLEDKKIIVIDDDVRWAELIRTVLVKEGAEIEQEIDYKKILNNLELLEHFDAVIVDYYILGEIKGPEIIKEIRKVNPKIMILAVSCKFINEENKPQTKEMLTTLSAGANRVTPKSFNEIVDILVDHFKIRKLNLRLI